MSARPRTGARVAAVQALFQSEQAGASPEAVIEEFIRHRLGGQPEAGGFEEGQVPAADVKLFTRIVRTAALQQEALDRRVAGALPEAWPFARLDPVLRALLRAAAAELSIEGAPARVLLNEYLDVAHGFFTGDEPRMVNGLLDRLARELRPGELRPGGAGRGESGRGESPPGEAPPGEI